MRNHVRWRTRARPSPRALLAEAAERTLDAQYYIWQNDMTGRLLFEALHAATDRGVRVRFLMDDNTTQGLDPTLASLDSHPEIEVRLVLDGPTRTLGHEVAGQDG